MFNKIPKIYFYRVIFDINWVIERSCKSLYLAPTTDSPTGQSCINPAGMVICGKPAKLAGHSISSIFDLNAFNSDSEESIFGEIPGTVG